MRQLLDPCDEVLEVISKLSSILNSEIKISSTLPSFLCQNCEEKLTISFEFNQLCLKSHEFILASINSLNSNQINKEEGDKSQDTDCGNILNLLDTEKRDGEFTEICKKSKTKQVMKLTQYSQEDVNKVIQGIRNKYFEARNCLYCNFTAKDLRALSVHMTRLHLKYKGTWCSKCNQTVMNLKQHVQNEHRDEFKCPFCGKESNSTGHFMEHLACHTVVREFVCVVCNKCFISSRHLKAHTKVHDNSKALSCHLCSASFLNENILSEHMKSHKKQKCKICDDIFDQNNYESHKCFVRNNIQDTNNDNPNETVRTTSISGTSDTCSKYTKEVPNLEEHVLNIHRKVNGIKALCTYCGKQFRGQSKLSVHLRVHTGEAPYKCTYCDARMATRTHIVIHERIHTGAKPHVCKFCGKGFSQSGVLNTHMKIHTGRTEHCRLCPKKFCRRSELRQHMRKHTGEKPYSCSYCEKAFKQKSHLVEHMWTHSEEKPFKCEHCDKGFKQASSLKSHLNIHLEKKSFKCSQCSYECQQSSSLNEHMLQHENGPPQPANFHRCELCDENFTTLDMFTSHCSSHHLTDDMKIDFIEMEDGEERSGLLQQLL
ncbi:hypothetical protein JTB14_007452 [Gonioctena quinquepunctata]|nr:hypothetical protein JTB14_007452 [Gonioctena quinquepunctata]